MYYFRPKKIQYGKSFGRFGSVQSNKDKVGKMVSKIEKKINQLCLS